MPPDPLGRRERQGTGRLIPKAFCSYSVLMLLQADSRVALPVVSTSGLRYLFIDFNAYFASVEQHDDQALRGRPVIVTPLPGEHTGAIAASYEAKALGISRGTSVADARRLCPDIVIRAARHDRYVAVHHRLMAAIERRLPIVKICSIDECVCRLDPSEGTRAAAMDKAEAIKRGIAQDVGPALRCSIGLAPSSLLAKLAAELRKPDGLTAIERSDLPHALHGLPLRGIPGVGGGVERRLERAGVTDFAGLWALAPKQARAIWGSVQGERFLLGLHGHDIPQAGEPDKKMIGHSRVLSGAHRRPAGARIVARALLLKAASRLRHYGLHAGAMNVTVKIHPEGAMSHDAVLRPTQNSWRFLEELDAFWTPMMRALAIRAGTGGRLPSMRMVSIHLFDLSDRPPERDLFIPEEQDRRDRRQAELWTRIDTIARQHGRTKAMLASQAGLDLNYLGVKIAFSRVPDAAEFADMGGVEAVTGAVEHHHESRAMNPARALY